MYIGTFWEKGGFYGNPQKTLVGGNGLEPLTLSV